MSEQAANLALSAEPEHEQAGQVLLEAAGPGGITRLVPAAIQGAAQARAALIFARHPWLKEARGAVKAIVRADVTHKKRLKMLRSLADRISSAIAPQAPCSRGCSGCCFIKVEITEWEAGLIAAELGEKVLPEPTGGRASRSEMDLLGQACGFLRDGACSIYASRPVVCRLHHSIGMDSSMCHPSVVPDESFVPGIDVEIVKAAVGLMGIGSRVGDISDFLPGAERHQNEAPKP